MEHGRARAPELPALGEVSDMAIVSGSSVAAVTGCAPCLRVVCLACMICDGCNTPLIGNMEGDSEVERPPADSTAFL